MRVFAATVVVFASLFFGRMFAQQSEIVGSTDLSPAQQAALALLPTIKGAANPRIEIVTEESQRIVGTLKASLTTPSMAVDTFVVVAPKLPSFDGQQVISQTTNLDPIETVDQSPDQRALLRSKVEIAEPASPSALMYESKVTVQLYSRRLQQRGRTSRKVEDLSPLERDRYLIPNRFYDYESLEFKDWKKQRGFVREKRESEFGFAHRVFQSITTEYSYEFDFGQDRTAKNLCQLDKTDCGGISILFTTVMRSEAIPARTLVGRWAESAPPASTPVGEREEAYHVIAEFFATDIGWIPVDGASAMLHDKTPKKTKYFGNQAGNMVTFHFDQELYVDSDLWGISPIEFMQTPKFWFRGTGAFDDQVFTHDWIVEQATTKQTEASTGKSATSKARNSKAAPADFVFLPLVHVRQPELLLCAPTSASMVLLRYGMQIPPQKIKQLANSVATDKSFRGTYYVDMVGGLETLGLVWTTQQFAADEKGFAEGLAVVEKSLREGKPVIVDTFVPPNGHTVVINGLDPNRQLISIVDPFIPAPGLRSVTFVEFERLWRSVIVDTRGCILTAPMSH